MHAATCSLEVCLKGMFVNEACLRDAQSMSNSMSRSCKQYQMSQPWVVQHCPCTLRAACSTSDLYEACLRCMLVLEACLMHAREQDLPREVRWCRCVCVCCAGCPQPALEKLLAAPNMFEARLRHVQSMLVWQTHVENWIDYKGFLL